MRTRQMSGYNLPSSGRQQQFAGPTYMVQDTYQAPSAANPQYPTMPPRSQQYPSPAPTYPAQASGQQYAYPSQQPGQHPAYGMGEMGATQTMQSGPPGQQESLAQLHQFLEQQQSQMMPSPTQQMLPQQQTAQQPCTYPIVDPGQASIQQQQQQQQQQHYYQMNAMQKQSQQAQTYRGQDPLNAKMLPPQQPPPAHQNGSTHQRSPVSSPLSRSPYQHVTPPISRGQESPRMRSPHRSQKMSPQDSMLMMHMIQSSQPSPRTASPNSLSHAHFSYAQKAHGSMSNGNVPSHVAHNHSPSPGSSSVRNPCAGPPQQSQMVNPGPAAVNTAQAWHAASNMHRPAGPQTASIHHPHPASQAYPPQRPPHASAHPGGPQRDSRSNTSEASKLAAKQLMANSRRQGGNALVSRQAVPENCLHEMLQSSHPTNRRGGAAVRGRGRGKESVATQGVPAERGQPVQWHRQPEQMPVPHQSFQSDMEAMLADSGPYSHVSQPRSNPVPVARSQSTGDAPPSSTKEKTAPTVIRSNMSKVDALNAIQIKQELIESLGKSKGSEKKVPEKRPENTTNTPTQASSSGASYSNNQVNNTDRRSSTGSDVSRDQQRSGPQIQNWNLPHQPMHQQGNMPSSIRPAVSKSLPTMNGMPVPVVAQAPRLPPPPVSIVHHFAQQGPSGQMPSLIHQSSIPQGFRQVENEWYRTSNGPLPGPPPPYVPGQSAREKVYSLWQSGQVVGRAPGRGGPRRTRRGRGRGGAPAEGMPTSLQQNSLQPPPSLPGSQHQVQQYSTPSHPMPDHPSSRRVPPVMSQQTVQPSNVAPPRMMPHPPVSVSQAPSKPLQPPAVPKTPQNNDTEASKGTNRSAVNIKKERLEETPPKQPKKKDYFYAELHGHKLLCVTNGNRPYVLVHQFQGVCFPNSGVGSVSNCIDRALRIKRHPLDHSHKDKIISYLKNNGYLRDENMEGTVKTITLDDARRIYHYMNKIRNCTSDCVVELPSLNVNLEATLTPAEKHKLFMRIKQEKKSADDRLYGGRSPFNSQAGDDGGNESDRSDQTIAYGEPTATDDASSNDSSPTICWDGVEPKTGGLLPTIAGQVRSYKHQGENYLVVEDLCRILGKIDAAQFFACIEKDNVTVYNICSEILAFLNGIHFLFPPIASKYKCLVKEKDIGVQSETEQPVAEDAANQETEPRSERVNVKKEIHEEHTDYDQSPNGTDKQHNETSEAPRAGTDTSSETNVTLSIPTKDIVNLNNNDARNDSDERNTLFNGKRRSSTNISSANPKSMKMTEGVYQQEPSQETVNYAAASVDELCRTDHDVSQSTSATSLHIDIPSTSSDTSLNRSSPQATDSVTNASTAASGENGQKLGGPENFLSPWMSNSSPPPIKTELPDEVENVQARMENFLKEGGGSLEEPICISSPPQDESSAPPPDFSDFYLYDGFRVKVVPKIKEEAEEASTSTPAPVVDQLATISAKTGCVDDIELHLYNSMDGADISLRSRKSLLQENNYLKQENRALQDTMKNMQTQLAKAKQECETAAKIQKYYEGVIKDITSSYTEEEPITIE